jgi:hypothetical protein
MQVKNTICNEEIRNAIRLQLTKLNDYCVLYDNGRYEYAPEIALKIRVLLHNTRNSKSLYEMIKERNMLNKIPLFMDFRCLSMIDPHADAFVAQFSSFMISYNLSIKEDPKEQEPMTLSFRHETKYTLWSFEDWWDKLIVCQWHNERLTRKDVVRLLSDQDGGAHVDENIDSRLYELKRNLVSTVTFVINNTEFTVGSDLLLATIVRTIAEEVQIVFNTRIVPNLK